MDRLRRLAQGLYRAARTVLTRRTAPPSGYVATRLAEFCLDLAPPASTPVQKADGSVRDAIPNDDPGGVRLHLCAGEAIETPAVEIGPDHVVRLRAAGTGASSLRIEICSDADPTRWSPLANWSINASIQPIEIGLHGTPGSRRLRVVSANGDLELFEMQICARHRCGRLRALSGYTYRMTNEVKNFSGSAYTHPMYGASAATSHTGEGLVQNATVGRPQRNLASQLEVRAEAHLRGLAPTDGETAFNYAMRGLGILLPMTPPDFFARARERSAAGHLSILSICSGAARIEEQILAHCDGTVHLTLLDASNELTQRAADRLTGTSAGRRVECLVGDINRGLPGSNLYDIVICVSALHHVADLETVLAQTNERLAEGGELWSIGEQIGRNGNRLWPDTLTAANLAFAELPPRLRRNAHTGQIDETIPDHDFSIGCFEGIRSEELEVMLEAHFIPSHVYKRNAFLWRLVDATYSDNFDLGSNEDVAALRKIIIAEAVHWATGGRSTELHGIYRKKTLR